MKQCFYIRDFDVEGVGYNALNKSRKDLDAIYQSLSFKRLDGSNLVLQDEKFRNLRRNSKMLSGYVDALLERMDECCRPGDYLFMDFPFAVKFLGFSKLVAHARSRKIRVVFFLHDLDGVRFRNTLLNALDSTCLDMAYALISASKEMNRVLWDNLHVSHRPKIVEYEYWDYLMKDVENRRKKNLLCFAGNLAKSTFLSDVPLSLVERGFALYGKGMRKDYRGDFCGEFDDETIVSEIDGLFGLVWDGNSARTCAGNFGSYLRINASHKFSLYMAAKKPVIVWKESALRHVVEGHQVGLAVSSLDEIPYRVSALSLSEYEKMEENVLHLRHDILTGDHLRKVILSAANVVTG